MNELHMLIGIQKCVCVYIYIHTLPSKVLNVLKDVSNE